MVLVWTFEVCFFQVQVVLLPSEKIEHLGPCLIHKGKMAQETDMQVIVVGEKL